MILGDLEFGVRETFAVLMAVVIVVDWAALRYARRPTPRHPPPP
jgi:hypothetical protein